jgi:cell division protein FtsB
MFFVWILFLDSNNLMARVGLTRKLNTLENEKEYYEEKILEVRADHEELFGNRDMLEKFAREKYLMKKETEDVFLIVEE